MKRFAWLPALAFLAMAGSASAVVSVFDFNGNFDATTGPSQMSLFNGKPFGTFGSDTIGGQNTGVYQFGIAQPDEGLKVDHMAPPNGGGSYVNEYTLGFDVKWTGGSPWASFFQTNTSNSNDGDLFRDPTGGIGISGVYNGTTVDDQWARVMFVWDLADLDGDGQTLYKYINGVQVGVQNPGGLDGRFSLDPFMLLLTDNDGESSAGSISSFLFADQAMTAGEIAAYGGPTAAGFAGGAPAVPEPGTIVLLGLGALGALRRRRAR